MNDHQAYQRRRLALKRTRPLLVLVGTGAASLVTLPQAALAAPEEIQVYMDELNSAGETGLDLHINDVTAGDPGPAFPGGEASLHRWRVTPEWSLGLGNGFELGAYLPMATIAPGAPLRADGAKIRIKWLAPHDSEGFYWGANYETGWSDHFIDNHAWNNEVKLIAGWRRGRWLIASNINSDFALSGTHPGPLTLDFDEKLGYRLTSKLTLGVETYNQTGPVGVYEFGNYDQSTFLTADLKLRRWDINAGIGKAYGGNQDHMIVKFIVSVPMP